MSIKKNDIKLKGHTLPVGKRTCIMGVLNVTPDSFSDGGRYDDPKLAAGRAREMIAQGADMIDVGGESSRPGSARVNVDEELDRVMPVIKMLKETVDVPLSIDTYKSGVAREALSAGATIVNDITALRGDEKMARTIAEFGAGVVLMHMKGTPGTMQESPHYDNVMGQIRDYLEGSIRIAEDAGIDPDKIIVDPGIGFGKKVEDNLTILKELYELQQLGKPVLIGTSRKSFIGKLTGKDVQDRVLGTAASFAVAVMNGASIIRAHDIDQMRDVARITDAITAR